MADNPTNQPDPIQPEPVSTDADRQQGEVTGNLQSFADRGDPPTAVGVAVLRCITPPTAMSHRLGHRSLAALR